MSAKDPPGVIGERQLHGGEPSQSRRWRALEVSPSGSCTRAMRTPFDHKVTGVLVRRTEKVPCLDGNNGIAAASQRGGEIKMSQLHGSKRCCKTVHLGGAIKRGQDT